MGGRWYRALRWEVLEEDPLWGGCWEEGNAESVLDILTLGDFGGCWVRGPEQRKAGDSGQGGEAPFKAA